MRGRGIPQPASRQPGPRPLALALAVLAAMVCLAAAPRASHAAPVKAEVTGTTENGHGRLVFTFAEDVGADVKHAGSVLVIAFKQPVDVAIERVANNLAGYVSAVRRDPDGGAVRLALTRRVKVNVMPAADKLFVDLLPENWRGLPPGLPQEVVDDLARRARAAEEKLKHVQRAREKPKLQEVTVRVASLPTFTRLIFPISQTVEVMASHARQRLEMVFSAPLKFDLADVVGAASGLMSSIGSEIDGERTTVHIALADKVDIRTFREEGAFAVDLTPIRPDGAGGRGEGGPRPLGAAEEEKPPARSASGSPSSPSSAPASSAPAAAPPAATPAHETPRTAERREKPPAAPAAEPDAPSDPDAPVRARVVRQGESLRLLFPFRTATAAAILRRADTVWLVFDSTHPLDVGALTEQAGAMVRAADVTRSEEGYAIRLRLAGRRTLSAVAHGATWIVALGDDTLEPSAPLPIDRKAPAQGDPIVTIGFEQPQRIHRIPDADGDGTLFVVTGPGPARGVVKGHEFIEFGVLASVHGVAVEPVADDIALTLEPERIVVRRPSGLAITADQSGNGGFGPGPRPSPVNAQVWAMDRNADFEERRAFLMTAVVEAPELRRNAARQDLARFFLAQDRAPEAKGLLDVTLNSDRGGQADAGAHLLRGLANLMLGRPEAALKDFSAPDLGDQHASALWRSVALSRSRRYPEAYPDLQNADMERVGLPVELQRLVVGEAARCALEVGDPAEAARRLNELEALGVPPEMRAMVELLLGLLAERLQRPRDALAAYRIATETRNEPTAAQARLRMVALRHMLSQSSRDATIADLEMLTAGWRGDDTEAEGLSLLARLYADDGRYREAFELMRLALGVHPRSRFTRTMQDEAAVAFDSIFLGDRGGALSPVEALGLFYDFSALTPAGRRGDEMIRRLAERLIAMDLLSKAGELLQHQIDHRLQGAARARVASRLAMVYLMDRKPDRALNALRKTRVSELPNDLRRQRVLLEARALSDSARHDLGLELIAHLEGREVERLRADIHWAARHWNQAAEEIERFHGDRWRAPEPLDEIERNDMLRAAVGYALADDPLGLDRLREKYLPRMPEGPEQRLFAVVTEPLSARTEEFAEAAKTVSAVDTLAGFLRDLRARYPDSGTAGAGVPATPPARQG